MKIIFITLLLLLTNKIYSQKLKNTFWIQENSIDKFRYFFYNDRNMYYISYYKDGKISISEPPYFYGFYNNCVLPSIDSLNNNGEYYFEVFKNDFDKDRWDEKEKRYKGIQCISMSIDTVGKDIYMKMQVMGMSPLNGFVSFKKLKKFPQKIIDFVKSKGIILPDENK